MTTRCKPAWNPSPYGPYNDYRPAFRRCHHSVYPGPYGCRNGVPLARSFPRGPRCLYPPPPPPPAPTVIFVRLDLRTNREA